MESQSSNRSSNNCTPNRLSNSEQSVMSSTPIPIIGHQRQSSTSSDKPGTPVIGSLHQQQLMSNQQQQFKQNEGNDITSSSSPGSIQLQQQQQQVSNNNNGNTAVAVASSSIIAGTTPPNSAGLLFRFPSVNDEIRPHRTSLHVPLAKRRSADSLDNCPATPGIPNWSSEPSKYDGNSSEKSPDTAKLNRKESYKAQRKNYRREKKRVASELFNSLQDPAVIVLADWLKIRGTLKSWTKLWCVLKPGLLLIYKSPKTKSSHWVGTVVLSSCQIIERPSKKDGFCFKLFHPMDQSIWASRGPDKETMGAVIQPLPTAYLIFRAPSQAAGKCWMDALELSLRCSALLLRSNSNSGANNNELIATNISVQSTCETQWSDADYEKHFNDQGKLEKPQFTAKFIPPTPPLDKRSSQVSSDYYKTDYKSETTIPTRNNTPILQNLYLTMVNWERAMAHSPDLLRLRNLRCANLFRSKSKEIIDDDPEKQENHQTKFSRSNTFTSDSSDDSVTDNCISSDAKDNLDAEDNDNDNEGVVGVLSGPDSGSESEHFDIESIMSRYPETPYVEEPDEEFGSAGEQVEELPEEHKNLLWFILKQVRPGMDLSKVVLPTFILEPRSFLDKLSDSYYHADMLSSAVLEDDPLRRMKMVVAWYLSGFYKKPKGLKKPYNPILGETFRCYWKHPNGSRTFYIAEQISHHPPISAFYVTNRRDGFCISCSILTKSKFYGNSTAALMEGEATLTLLPRRERYTLNIPYAHCKGILMGTLSMELGGKINIECDVTGYKTEIEFKLKPLFGGSDITNSLVGKIKYNKETKALISGHWDGEMIIKDTYTGLESVLFSPTREVRDRRLKRCLVPLNSQDSTESEFLWQHVTSAIRREDQVKATQEKSILEDSQRLDAKTRKENHEEWIPTYFEKDLESGKYLYKYADLSPWDSINDVKQYESGYKILTQTRTGETIIPTGPAVSFEDYGSPIRYNSAILSAIPDGSKNLSKMRMGKKRLLITSKMSLEKNASDSDEVVSQLPKNPIVDNLIRKVEDLSNKLERQSRQLSEIQETLDQLRYAPRSYMINRHSSRMDTNSDFLNLIRSFGFIFLGLMMSFIYKLILTKLNASNEPNSTAFNGKVAGNLNGNMPNYDVHYRNLPRDEI